MKSGTFRFKNLLDFSASLRNLTTVNVLVAGNEAQQFSCVKRYFKMRCNYKRGHTFGIRNQSDQGSQPLKFLWFYWPVFFYCYHETFCKYLLLKLLLTYLHLNKHFMNGGTVRIWFKKLLNKKEIWFKKKFISTKLQFTVNHDSK